VGELAGGRQQVGIIDELSSFAPPPCQELSRPILRILHWHEPGHRLSSLGDHNFRLAGRNVVDQRQATLFEQASRHLFASTSSHGHSLWPFRCRRKRWGLALSRRPALARLERPPGPRGWCRECVYARVDGRPSCRCGGLAPTGGTRYKTLRVRRVRHSLLLACRSRRPDRQRIRAGFGWPLRRRALRQRGSASGPGLRWPRPRPRRPVEAHRFASRVKGLSPKAQSKPFGG
jgi:hypothetical protein